MSKIIDIKSGMQVEGTSRQRWYKKTSVRYFQVAMLAILLGGVSSLTYAMYVLVVGPSEAACTNVGFGFVLMASLIPAVFGVVLLRIGIPGSAQSFQRPKAITHREGMLVGLGMVLVLLVASTAIGSLFQRGMTLSEQTTGLQRSSKIDAFVERMGLPPQERQEMVAKVAAMSDEALQAAGILPLTCK